VSNSSCVVLVPFSTHIVPQCERGLDALERAGYAVRRVAGYSQIDFGRCALASQALRDGFDELMWIDSDIGFDPADVDKLRSRNLPMVCGLYRKKGPKEFACEFLPGTRSLVFGEQGGLKAIRYAGFGFMHTRRLVYEAITRHFALPECNQRGGGGLRPYFLPMIHTELDDKAPRYLAEDYAFCERARQAGLACMTDTTIRLRHVGMHEFVCDS
jgi:hypothetical protein